MAWLWNRHLNQTFASQSGPIETKLHSSSYSAPNPVDLPHRNSNLDTNFNQFQQPPPKQLVHPSNDDKYTPSPSIASPDRPKRVLRHHTFGDSTAHDFVFKNHYDAACYSLISQLSNNPQYNTGRNHWINWRRSRNLPEMLEPAQNELENNENILEILRFMMYFVLEAPGVNHANTVTQYIVHVKDAHLQLMFRPSAMYSGKPFVWPADTNDSRIRVLKSKINQWYSETPQEEGGRLPLTPGLIKYEIMSNALDTTTHDGRVVLTVQLLTMFGGFRMGELLVTTKNKKKRKIKKDCCVKDVEVFADTLHIKVSSKTLNKIETVVVYRNEVDAVTQEFGVEFDVFKLVKTILKGKHSDELLFTRDDGTPFTYNHYMKILVAITDAMGIPRGHFGGHSGRIYMATLLALQGMQDSYIQNRGRWLSLCFKMYVRSLNIRRSSKQQSITHFKLSNLTFVLKGFPDTPEFRKRLR